MVVCVMSLPMLMFYKWRKSQNCVQEIMRYSISLTFEYTFWKKQFVPIHIMNIMNLMSIMFLLNFEQIIKISTVMNNMKSMNNIYFRSIMNI